MVSFAGFAFVFGFLLGILAIVTAEVAGFLYIVKRLNRKRNVPESNSSSDPTLKSFDPRQSVDFSLNKQGVIWVLEMNESLKDWMKEPLTKEQKKKRDLMEVHPVRRFARIKDHKLYLSDSDGTQTSITLKGCFVDAVSGSGPTRKWAKRFPIQVESKTSVLYKGNRVFYIFLETSWEKESWCKALRLAACENQERFIWSTKLKDDFRNYLASLNAAYPSFLKHSAGFSFESLDKGLKTDGPSSKVRLFWKKFSRKCSTKVNMPPLNREDKKTSPRPNQNSHSTGSSGRSTPARKMQDNIPEETDVQVMSRSWSHSSHVSDVDPEDKFVDEGTLALNLLISRLFFDVKQNTMLKNLVRERIQRVLSNMRIPSYIGELVCTDVGIGNLPPYIHVIRILPMEMNGLWAFELDVEYTGGAGLEVETRVDAREEDLQKGLADGKLQPNSVGDVPQDLLEGLADFGTQLSVPGGNVNPQDVKNGGSNKADEPKVPKGTNAAPNNHSKWKSILKNIAEQVSQVPITLSIGVSSLRGTLCVHMKPPPSDQLWFGFTSMPNIEFNLVSSVGEHKITNSHVAMFLINRFKTGIREVMVLPNCESVTIPWMTAEKDDWVERDIAPFIWLNQDSNSDHDSFEAAEGKPKPDKPPNPERMQETAEIPQEPKIEEEHVSATLTNSTAPILKSDRSLEELKTPLLESSEKQNIISRGGSAGDFTPSIVHSLSMSVNSSEEDDSNWRGKKIGITKARMFDLRKKVGEKFEATAPILKSDRSLEELKTPLLESSEKQNIISRGGSAGDFTPSIVHSLSMSVNSSEEDDSNWRGKKIGITKARMFDLRKKVGEKFEEKKRHMEEKSRQIVEKMRGP